MELKWLEDFLSLCNSGNFRVSSEQRFVSQPAFSRRIKALETWLGAELIDRTSFPVQPTNAGREFRTVAQNIVNLAYQKRNDIRGQGNADKEKINFSTLNTLAQVFIPAWLKELEPYHEAETFSVRTDFRSVDGYLVALEEGLVDFFICYEDQTGSIMIDPEKYPSLQLGVESVMPVVSPDNNGKPNWWLPSKPQKPIPHLCTKAHLTRPARHHLEKRYGLSLPVRHHIEKHYGDLTFVPAYEASTATSIKAMALEGYGVAWLPKSIVIDELSNGRLVRAAEEADDMMVDIKIFRSADSIDRRVEKFWQMLVQRASS